MYGATDSTDDSKLASPAPDDPPDKVILSGSPPKFRIFLRIQKNAASAS